MRIRRAAQNTVPSGGGPCSSSTAYPSRRASQHKASHTPAGGSRERAGGVVADGRPGGLGQVPDVGNPVGLAPGRSRLVLVLVLALCARPGRDGEDRDAVLALADLPSGRGPLLVVPDQGGAGPLGVDEQDVREVLAGQPRGQAQAGAPVTGRAQRPGVIVQAGAQPAERALAVLLAFAILAGQVRGHHGSPGGWPPAAWPAAAASSDRRAWLATRWPSRRSRSPSAFWLSRSPCCAASVTMRTASLLPSDPEPGRPGPGSWRAAGGSAGPGCPAPQTWPDAVPLMPLTGFWDVPFRAAPGVAGPAGHDWRAGRCWRARRR